MRENGLYRKTAELNLSYFIGLARKQVGQEHTMAFQAKNKFGQKAGTFKILSFEEQDPHFVYGYYGDSRNPEDWQDEPTGAELGYYTVQLCNTKFYNGKVMRCKVKALVQDNSGVTDELSIQEKDEDTGKILRAYYFPLLNLFEQAGEGAYL